MTTYDRDEAVASYVEALHDFRDLAASLAPEDWARATDLPGWSVQDTVAHVVGVESELAGHGRVEHAPDWSALAHVDPGNPFHLWTEVPVDMRRGRTPEELMAELAVVIGERWPQISAYPADSAAEVIGPAGSRSSLWRLTTVRVFDIWAHEQDVRRAIGRPGNVDGSGARVTAFRLRFGLEYVIGKSVAPPPGTAVRWVVEGPVSFVSTIVVGADGRAAETSDYVGEPTVTLATDWENFVLLGCGRASFDRSRVTIEGDAGLGEQVLLRSAVTP